MEANHQQQVLLQGGADLMKKKKKIKTNGAPKNARLPVSTDERYNGTRVPQNSEKKTSKARKHKYKKVYWVVTAFFFAVVTIRMMVCEEERSLPAKRSSELRSDSIGLISIQRSLFAKEQAE